MSVDVTETEPADTQDASPEAEVPQENSADDSATEETPESEEQTPEETFRLRSLALREELSDAALQLLELEVQVKAAKATYKEEVEELRRHIAKGPEKFPLFDPPAADEPTGTDHWRSVTVTEVGIPEGLCTKLRENPENPLATLGDIVDWQADGYHHLTDIPGIGEGKADQLEKCMTAYWDAHPEHSQPAAEEG